VWGGKPTQAEVVATARLAFTTILQETFPGSWKQDMMLMTDIRAGREQKVVAFYFSKGIDADAALTSSNNANVCRYTRLSLWTQTRVRTATRKVWCPLETAR
jgi:hypothetical protein